MDEFDFNARDGSLEVYRAPRVDARAPFGHGYAERSVYLPGESVTPPPLPVLVSRLSGP